MRVLVVTNMYPSANRPTYGIFVSEQVEALRRADPMLDIDVEYIDPQTRGRFVYLKSIGELRRKIDSGDYDLVHIHYGLSGLFLLNPMWKPKVPVVLTLHGGDIQPEQGKGVQVALTRRILPKVDCAIALNDRMSSLARSLCPRVEQIPCAVNTELFTPPLDPRPELDGQQKLTIIFPSAHSRVVKNYPLFQQTLSLLKQNYGIEAEEIELNNMSRHDIAWAMGRADLLLLTSISEGSPQVVKEAMACNLPVVSTPVGDVNVLLEGVKNCAVAAPEGLAEAVVDVIKGNRQGIEPRQKLLELGLDAESTSRKIISLYQSLLNS